MTQLLFDRDGDPGGGPVLPVIHAFSAPAGVVAAYPSTPADERVALGTGAVTIEWKQRIPTTAPDITSEAANSWLIGPWFGDNVTEGANWGVYFYQGTVHVGTISGGTDVDWAIGRPTTLIANSDTITRAFTIQRAANGTWTIFVDGVEVVAYDLRNTNSDNLIWTGLFQTHLGAGEAIIVSDLRIWSGIAGPTSGPVDPAAANLLYYAGPEAGDGTIRDLAAGSTRSALALPAGVTVLASPI